MIPILKKQLSESRPFFFPLFLLIHLVCLVFIFKKFFIFIVLLYVIIFLFFLFVNIRSHKQNNLLEIKKQDLIEKSNLLREAIQKETLLASSIDKKNLRYASLKRSLDNFNQSLVLEEVGTIIVEETYKLFGGGACVILYMVDQKTNTLQILSSKKPDEALVIKEKSGDLFDNWVMVHDQALLVEDVAKDFRFDPERIKKEISRRVGSLMITPLVIATKFLGVLRVEWPEYGKMTSDDLRFLGTIANLASISLENALLYRDTEELAIRDGLTGLYLRRYLEERGAQELSYAARKKNELSVLTIDIDHFKACNDQYGHHFGDIVLLHIADLLRGIFQEEQSVISRFGGEEFAVLLLGTTKPKAKRIAEDLRKSIRGGIIFLRRQPVHITVSIGVANYPHDADTWLDLIKRSDAALYSAKQQGRDRVCTV